MEQNLETTAAERVCVPRAFKIAAIKVENAYTKTFVLDGTLPASPGQFVMAWLPGYEDKPFSLAGASPVSLTVAAVGRFSRALHRRRAGESLWLRGPFGRGFQLPPPPATRGPLLLVGGGYGVAPLFFLAQRALAAGHQVRMVIGARRKADLLRVEAFEALGVPLWLATEDGSVGQRGLATDAVSTALSESAGRPAVLYACGPTGMLQALAGLAGAEQIPVQLAWEAHMRCALGLCGSCEVGRGWLTCLDGPVFPFDPLAVPP